MTLTEKHNQRREQFEQALDKWIDEVKTDLTDLLNQGKLQTITYKVGNTTKEVENSLKLNYDMFLSDEEDALGVCLDEEGDVCVVGSYISDNLIETSYIRSFPDNHIIWILSDIDWESAK